MTTRILIQATAIALLVSLMGMPDASAAEPAAPPTPAALPPHIAACAPLRRDSERLACYDRAVATLQAGGDAAPPPSAENMFGANSDIAQSGVRQGEVKREELRQITGSVTSLRRLDDGMIQIELDNGQVWRQQDSAVKLLVALGDTVTVVRASMGTFRISDKTGRYARFKRVR